MLAVDQRLRRREEFTAAVRGGRRAGRGSVVIHLAMPTPGTGPAPPAARAGFVVPRAVGNAVVRNRVRRRLRHLVRDRLDALPPGTLLVVRALAGAGGATYAQLSQDLDAALSAARTPRHTRTSGGVVSVRTSLLARMLALPIIAYRRWISPALPARCRFHPSCSAYALEAIATHGAVRGFGLAGWRLLRCHPFHPGGYDPVPPPRRRRADADVTGALT